jgi:hypothetical protein
VVQRVAAERAAAERMEAERMEVERHPSPSEPPLPSFPPSSSEPGVRDATTDEPAPSTADPTVESELSNRKIAWRRITQEPAPAHPSTPDPSPGGSAPAATGSVDQHSIAEGSAPATLRGSVEASASSAQPNFPTTRPQLTSAPGRTDPEPREDDATHAGEPAGAYWGTHQDPANPAPASATSRSTGLEPSPAAPGSFPAAPGPTATEGTSGESAPVPPRPQSISVESGEFAPPRPSGSGWDHPPRPPSKGSSPQQPSSTWEARMEHQEREAPSAASIRIPEAIWEPSSSVNPHEANADPGPAEIPVSGESQPPPDRSVSHPPGRATLGDGEWGMPGAGYW